MSESSSDTGRDPDETTRWWGDFRVPHDSAGCWQIGPMNLWIQRLRGEWRVATDAVEDDVTDPATDPAMDPSGPESLSADPGYETSGAFRAVDFRTGVTLPAEDVNLLALDSVRRFGLSGAHETIRITPQLADRPVVTTPQRPFYIPPHERATVHVSSPLWLRIEAPRTDGDDDDRGSDEASSRRPSQDSGRAAVTLLCELPIVRPTDTWFGPTPYQGELCYASTAFCRLRLEEVIPRPFRAVTTATIINATELPFLLERMKLPVEYLPLFVDRDGRFWTRDIEYTHTAGNDHAVLHHDEKQPSRAREPELLAPPRHEHTGNLVTRAFSSLFFG